MRENCQFDIALDRARSCAFTICFQEICGVKKIKEAIMHLHQAYKSIAQKEGMKKTQRHFEEEQDEMPRSSYISVLKQFRIIFN